MPSSASFSLARLPKVTRRASILICVSIAQLSIAQVLGDALQDVIFDSGGGGAGSGQPAAGPSGRLVQLDGASFELTADAYNFETNTYTTLQERYSSQQERGRVKLSTKSIDGSTGAKIEQTHTHFVDTKLDASLRRNELTNECEPTSWNSILAHLGFGLIEFESNASGHLFGAARLLRYFTVHRSQLQADLSGEHYLSRGGHSSIRYVRRFVTRRQDGQSADSEPIVLEVSVFYTEASLAGAPHWAQALPVRIQGDYPHEQRKGFVLEFGPIKFVQADDLDGASDQLGVLMDGLALEPASGCSRAIGKRTRLPWAELQGSRRRTDSFSFWAKGRHLTVDIESHFQARVAYDVWLNKLRVDMESDGLNTKTIQITDLTLDRTTHILPLTDQSRFLSDLLIGGSRNRSEPQVAADERPQRPRDSPRPTFKCINGEVNSTPLTAPILTLDNLLTGGSEDYAYLGLARVRGIRARIFEAVDTQLPFWLDPQIHTAASTDRFRSRAELRQMTTVIYLSEPSQTEPSTRLLLMEIHEMDAELKSTYSNRELSVFDFAWNLQAMGSSEQSGGRQAMGLFSLLDLCSEWLPGSGDEQEASESRAHFQMVLRSEGQVAGELLAWLRANPSALQLSLLSAIQLNMHLVLGLISDFETRPLAADGVVAGAGETLTLTAEFDVCRLPDRLNKMMFLGRGRRVPNKSWFIRVVSLQECFMFAAHRQFEVEFAFDATHGYCYIATEPRHSSAPLNPKDAGPFRMEPHGAMNVYKTLKLPDYHKPTREWWLKEPELGSRRRPSLSLAFGARDERIGMRIDRMRVTQHQPHLLHAQSGLAGRVDALLGVGLRRQETGLNRLGHVEPLRGRNSLEQRLTLGQCRALCETDFSCQSYSFCLRGIQAECLLSKANLNEPKILSEARLFLLNKTVSSREFKLESNQSVTLSKSRNCATYNKQYLDYYAKTSHVTSGRVSFQRAVPAAELKQCAELCFRQLLESHHHETLNKLGQPTSPNNDIFAQRTERSELEDVDAAEGCSKFYYVDVAGQSPAVLSDHFGLAPKSRAPAGVCLLAAIVPSAGLKLRWAELEPDRVVGYELKFSQLYDEEHEVSLRRSSLSESESDAIRRVALVGLEREAKLDVESQRVARQLLDGGENLQMMTFVDREICARFCYTQSAGLWPHCSSFDVIVTRRTDAGGNLIKCVLNSSSKGRLLASGREDLIDSSGLTAENSTIRRWHYELKEGFVGHRQVDPLKAHVEWEGGGRSQRWPFVAPGDSPSSVLPLYLAMSVGVFLGIILMEMIEAKRTRPRRDSVGSRLELFKL